MSKRSLITKCSRGGRRAALGILLACGLAHPFQAQGTKANPEEGPGAGTNYIAPESYTFQMRLKPGVDVAIKLKNLPKKQNPVGGASSSATPSAVITLRRDFRPGIIRVVQDSGVMGKGSVYYYVGGWCAYDDVRRGLNVVRPSFEGLVGPMEVYHFPELLWAKPKTRQPEPAVKEGMPKLNLYKEGNQTLEVDAASGYPVHFLDGDLEWTYSYTPDTTPIVVPGKLGEALSRVPVLQKR